MRRLLALATLLFALPAHAFTIARISESGSALEAAISNSNVVWRQGLG